MSLIDFFSDGRWRKYAGTIPPREFSISGDEFFLPAATQTPIALFMSDCRGFAKHGESRVFAASSKRFSFHVVAVAGWSTTVQQRNFAECKDARETFEGDRTAYYSRLQEILSEKVSGRSAKVSSMFDVNR